MGNDLPRIGPEPDCQYPGCKLLGRTRTPEVWGGRKIVCSLHADWDGMTTTPPVWAGLAHHEEES